MKRTKWSFAGVTTFIGVIGRGSRAHGQPRPNEVPSIPAPTYKSEEYLLIGDAIRGSGEPVIVVNPKNPNNIIVGAMATLHYVEGAPLGVGQEPDKCGVTGEVSQHTGILDLHIRGHQRSWEDVAIL